MLGGGHSADAAMWLWNAARLLAGGAHPFGGIWLHVARRRVVPVTFWVLICVRGVRITKTGATFAVPVFQSD